MCNKLRTITFIILLLVAACSSPVPKQATETPSLLPTREEKPYTGEILKVERNEVLVVIGYVFPPSETAPTVGAVLMTDIPGEGEATGERVHYHLWYKYQFQTMPTAAQIDAVKAEAINIAKERGCDGPCTEVKEFITLKEEDLQPSTEARSTSR